MGRLLFVVFVAVPLIEIAIFVLLGQAIGLWPTLLGVVVTAVAGSIVLRYQGLALFAEIRASMNRGELPARALADAMMVGIAGALLLTPGYFTDLMGGLLLVPPIRSVIYGYLRSRVQVVAGAAAYGRSPGADERTIDLDEDDWRRR